MALCHIDLCHVVTSKVIVLSTCEKFTDLLHPLGLGQQGWLRKLVGAINTLALGVKIGT